VIEPQARSREGWFRNRIFTRFAWEPPPRGPFGPALLTQEGGPPAPTAFHQTRLSPSFPLCPSFTAISSKTKTRVEHKSSRATGRRDSSEIIGAVD
jgi:hypothetical protein